jgi:hypothetical protein
MDMAAFGVWQAVVVASLALLLALPRLLVLFFDFETSTLLLKAPLVLNGWWGDCIDIDIGGLLTRRGITKDGEGCSLSAVLAVAMTHEVPAVAYQLELVAANPGYQSETSLIFSVNPLSD